MKIFLILTFIFSYSLVFSQEPSLYIRYGKWKNDMSNTKLTFPNLIEIGKDLGLDKKSSDTFGILYRGQKHRFSIDYFSTSKEEKIILNEDINFYGTLFEEGQEVNTYFKLEIKEFEYWYPLFNSPLFKSGFIIGLDLVKTKTAMEEVSVKKDEETPYLGIGTTIITPRTKAYVDISLTTTQWKDIEALSAKLETGLDITLNMGLFMGLKKLKLEMEEKDFDIDLSLSSFYVGVYLRL